MTDVAVSLATIAREWGRIGCIGFGGPPAHISLLRKLCVTERKWLTGAEFEDGVAATNLLPGPASTQLAIFCAWRLRATPGALVGGVCFIGPGLVLILALAALFLGSPPRWVQGAAAGAGAVVGAVALRAALELVPGSWRRIPRSGARRSNHIAHARWMLYVAAGFLAGAAAGPYLVVVLVACGLIEIAARGAPGVGLPLSGPRAVLLPTLVGALPAVGGLGALSWVALKVGLLSYGGGFVIIPLMRTDAVETHHWMSDGEFLNAVALGQITPGPVVLTVAVVGYAAAGLWGGALAALIAFVPSFVLVLLVAARFDRLRSDIRVQAFFGGAGPAVIGAIAGSAIPLALSLSHAWQYGVLVAAAFWLVFLRRGVVSALILGGALGALGALAAVTTSLPVTA